MKKYSFDVHYDMVITGIEVVAETMEEARELAYEQAARLPMEQMECVGKDACLGDTEELTERESHQMQAQAVIDYVHLCCKELTAYTYDREEQKANKRELADIAYRGQGLNWLEGMDVSNEEWQRKMFRQISDFEGINANGVCNRYARMLARKEFERRYKNVAKSLFEGRCEGEDRLGKKQAVCDGLEVLCDRMDDYVMHQDDEGYKGWEPQMVIRYESETGDEENYWNLFVYCHAPNDGEDGSDQYELATAWQHVWLDADGRDATDDYGTEHHDSRAALLRYLFYTAPQEFDETDETVCWQRMTDVWVD